MSICIIANVGQHDVFLNDKPLPKDALREKSLEVLNNYDNLKAQLRAPILEPVFDHILKTSRDKPQVRLVLVATDQQEGDFSKGDTVHCAEIIKKLVMDKYSNKASLTVAFQKINEPPNYYDQMFDKFSSWVKYNKFGIPEGDRVYLVCTGGTPACNTALLLTGIGAYRKNSEVIYVNEKNQSAYSIDVAEKILGLYRRERLETYLKRRDFSGIAADDEQKDIVRGVAASASARLNFDFNEMYRLMDECVKKNRTDLDKLWEETTQLAADNCPRERRLRELYWNALIKWDRAEYADFLGRMFRLCEESLRAGIYQVSGIELKGDQSSDNDFEVWVKRHTILLKEIENRKLKIRPTRDLMMVVLEYECRERKDKKLQRLLDSADALGKLSSLRNKSIIAHDVQGVSKEDILKSFDGDEQKLFDALNRIMEALDVNIASDPFEDYAEAIRKLNERK